MSKSDNSNLLPHISANDGDFSVAPELQRLAYLNILEDLQTDQKKIENQRIATFNILEDINDAQTELQRKFMELESLKDMIQKLGDSLEPHEIMQHIVEAIRKLFPDATVACVVASAEFSDTSNAIHLHTKEEIGEPYLTAIRDDVILFLNTLPEKEQLPINDKCAFKFCDGQIKQGSGLKPMSRINTAVMTSKTVIGVIGIFSAEKEAFGRKESSAVSTIVNSAAKTIERLRALVASEHSRLNDLLSSMTNGVLMFDNNKNLVIANAVLKEIVAKKNDDFTLSEFIRSFQEFPETSKNTSAPPPDISALIDKALNQQETSHLEEMPFKNRFFEVFVTPVRDYQKNISGGAIILHDITHLKEVDRMKTEFVSIVSHQLRTPLTSIKLFMEMLTGGDAGKLNKKQKDYLDNVQQSAQHMISLVNDLLNISRLEAGKIQLDLKPTDLKKLIGKVLQELDVIGKAHNCEINFQADFDALPKALADSSLMGQAFHNLISNAIQYSSSGKNRIDISINRTEDNNHLAIAVKDTGIGIPESAQKRIFEKFFRAENAIKVKTDGTGLGLYIVKMIIENMGGGIRFDSVVGQGTTFYITIPIDKTA